MSTTASINSKGCKGTGITPELAKRLHDNLGKTITVIAEITSDNRAENLKGDEKVNLIIDTIEVAPEGLAADHVQELFRSFHYERKLAEGENDGQLPLPGDSPEPKVEDVVAAGKRHEPHDYVDTPEAICDVCGQSGGAAIHQPIPADLGDVPDEE